MVDDPSEFTHVPPARSQRRDAPASDRGNASSRGQAPPSPSSARGPASYEGPPSHRPPRSDRNNDRRAEGYDEPQAVRSYAPPPQSSSRNDHFAHNSAPPPSSAPNSQFTREKPLQQHAHRGPAAYQQTMDVTGHNAALGQSQGHHTYDNDYNQSDSYDGYDNAPMQHGPMTGPPPPMTHGAMMQMGNAATMSAGMSAPPMPMSSPGMSAPPPAPSSNQSVMPAHFRMAQTGAITPAMDIRNNHTGLVSSQSDRSASRGPALSWAMALAAAGVFVGVVAVAIAQRGEPQDPGSILPPMTTQVAAPALAAPPVQNPNALPPGLLGASDPGTAPPATQPVPGMMDPNLGLAPPPASSPGVVVSEVKVPQTRPTSVRVTAGPHPVRHPVAREEDDDPPATKKPPAATGGKPKPKDTDEETRKALELLQKAQLESSSSFK